MNERKLNILLASVVALVFAAFAAGGLYYLRTFDAWTVQLEDGFSADTYVGLSEGERLDAYNQLYYQAVGAVDIAANSLKLAVILCVGIVLISLWVISIVRRNMKNNQPRAPAKPAA